MECFGILICKTSKRTEDLDCLIHGGLGLRLRRLDHERLVDDQWEIHCGRMNAVVKQALGDIKRGNTGFFMQPIQRHDKLVHTGAGVGHVVDILQRGHHIIRI